MDEIKAAEVIARCTRAMIRTFGMVSENSVRLFRGEAPAYSEKAFDDVMVEEGVDWNSVCKKLYH
jgi:hypothetical protein